MNGSGALVLFRTKQVIDNILLFWVLCALDRNCIQPVGRASLVCSSKAMKKKEFAGKSRVASNSWKKNFHLAHQAQSFPVGKSVGKLWSIWSNSSLPKMWYLEANCSFRQLTTVWDGWFCTQGSSWHSGLVISEPQFIPIHTTWPLLCHCRLPQIWPIFN